MICQIAEYSQMNDFYEMDKENDKVLSIKETKYYFLFEMRDRTL